MSSRASPIGGRKVLWADAIDVVTLIGAGVTVHHCLRAVGELAADGIAVRVVDVYWVKLLASCRGLRGTRRPGPGVPASGNRYGSLS